MSLGTRYGNPPIPVTWSRPTRAASRSDDRWNLIVALAIAGLIVVGMAIGVGTLTFAGVLIALVVALASPATGLIVLAVIAPLSPPLVLPAPGVPPALVMAILGGCLGRLAMERRSLRIGLPLFLALAFLLYVFAQQVPEMLDLWPGAQGRATVTMFIQVATVFAAALATALVVHGRPVAVYLVGLGVGAGLAASVALIVYMVPSAPAFVQNLTNEMTIVGRSIGPFLDPNYFGTFLATAAVLFMASFRMAHSRRVQVAVALLVVLVVAALVTTLSRGAFVALVAGVFALALTVGRRWAVATLLASVLIVAVVYPFFEEYRFGEASGSPIESVAASGREYAAAAGIRIFESSPLFGIGFAHYEEATVRLGGLSSPIQSHNWYVNVLAEQGIVGIVLWLGLMLAILRTVWRRDGLARRVGVAVLAAAAAGGISLQTPASFQTSALTAIALTMAMVGEWGRVVDRSRGVVHRATPRRR